MFKLAYNEFCNAYCIVFSKAVPISCFIRGLVWAYVWGNTSCDNEGVVLGVQCVLLEGDLTVLEGKVSS